MSGQRTPEVNKVALIALKYFNALIAAKLIASINALTLTALVFILYYIHNKCFSFTNVTVKNSISFALANYLDGNFDYSY